MSDKMYDTRELYKSDGADAIPANSRTIAVDKAEYEALKRAAHCAAARKVRGTRIAAALGSVKHGIMALVNVPVNIVLGLWCLVWGVLKCGLYACKYAVLGLGATALAVLFGPSMALAMRDHCDLKCGQNVYAGRTCWHSLIGSFSLIGTLMPFVALPLMAFGVADIRSEIGMAIFSATNILSLLYELGRAKRGKGKADAATETTPETATPTAATTPAPKPQVSERIQKLIAQAQAHMETLPLMLGNASLAQLVQAAKYDYPPNPNITDTNFPTPASGNGQTDAILFGFDEYVTTEEVEAVAEAMNLRLGTAKDGAHLGIQHPDRQRKHWIVCLKDDWRAPDGYRFVVVLFGGAGGRRAGLGVRRYGWHRYCRFVALAKSR